MNYEETMIEFFNKVLKDEMSSSIAYKRMSAMSLSPRLQEELSKHGDEEYAHFNQLLAFAYNHGFGNKISIELDQAVIGNIPTAPAEILAITQALETTAINDYKSCALAARDVKDLETEEFMMNMMKDEQKHFDDLSQFNGGKRPLSFIELLKRY